jgi:hypothetical protein
MASMAYEDMGLQVNGAGNCLSGFRPLEVAWGRMLVL